MAGGDFVAKRADGVIAYQLAVVVDDAAMQITDVLRGCDLTDSTPRQILLYEALGLRQPQFAHVPLLVDSDGRRLSKRDKSVTLSALRSMGKRAEDVVGVMAVLCGLSDRFEPVKASDLTHVYSEDKLPRESIVYTKQVQ